MADLRWLCVRYPSPMASPKLARLSNSSHPYNPIPTRQGLRRPVAAVALRVSSSRRNLRSFRCFSGSIFRPFFHSPPAIKAALTPELKSSLDKVVSSHKVLVFIKGTKEFPQCGFSNTVVQILKSVNVPFETINILENELLRQGLKEYSSWPTFPQLYIDGEFFGGCDITVEAYKSGELQEVLERAVCS